MDGWMCTCVYVCIYIICVYTHVFITECMLLSNSTCKGVCFCSLAPLLQELMLRLLKGIKSDEVKRKVGGQRKSKPKSLGLSGVYDLGLLGAGA